MITLLIGLLGVAPLLTFVFYTDFTIYGPGAVSYAPLEMVVTNRGWQGTEAFEVLVAPADCRLLARQGWLVTESGIRGALVVDCEAPEDEGDLETRGLLLDANRLDLLSENGWLILR